MVSFLSYPETMSEQIMVIASNVSFSETLTLDQVDGFPNIGFKCDENGVYPVMYEWYQRSGFERDLDEMYEYVKDERLKVKGTIFAVKREGENSDPQQVCIKLDRKGYEYIECSFNVSMRSDKPKKKSLKLEDKLALFKEYWTKHHKVPGPSEIYKDFKVGAFYKTCQKNSEVMEQVNEITGDK